MPVKIAEKGINYENIPEMIKQQGWINKLLLFNCFNKIFKLGSGSVMFRINDGVLYGTKIVENTPVGSKILTGAYDLFFSGNLVCTEKSILRPDSNHIKDGAS